jgi:hypothetical protein
MLPWLIASHPFDFSSLPAVQTSMVVDFFSDQRELLPDHKIEKVLKSHSWCC